MNKKFFGLFAAVVVIVVIAVFAFDKGIGKNNISKIDYSTFVKNASQVFSQELPEQYTLVSDNKALNNDYTGFIGGQKLDKRTNDSINGEMKEPSRYQFYFINKQKTVLVQLNLIYEPSYTNTKIISVTRHFPEDINYFDQSYSSITDIYTIGYLAAFNGGIAKIDFLLTNDANIEDKSGYLLQEGVQKFMPFVEDLLLSYNIK